MKKRMLNILLGIMAVFLLAGCGKAENGQAKEELTGGVVVRESTRDAEDEKENKKGGRKEEKAGEADEKESILDEAEVFEDKEEPANVESEAFSIVVGGIRLQIPGEYGCFIEESKGPIVYRDDLFVMLINVREDSYEERMEEPDTLMDGARKNGGEIIKEIDEVKIGENPYAWFTYSQNEDRFIVVYTPAADSGKRLCAQLVIEDRSTSEEDLLRRFAEIAESAEVTDEPDTTDETLKEAIMLADFGEKKRESVLKHGNVEITFQVEEGFYSQYSNTDHYWASEYFSEPVNLGTVDCYLEPVEDDQDAKAYVENEMQFAEESGEIHKDTVKINGHEFYYYIIKYEYNGSTFQKMVAASDVKKGYVYVVKAGYIDADDEMKQENYESFFWFETE